MTKLFLKPCAASGTGVHKFCFYAACEAVEAGLTDAEAIPLIENAMTRPPQPHNEIESALAAARREERPKGPKWPERDPELTGSILTQSTGEFEVPEITAEEAIDALFPADALLCIGRTSFDFSTRPRNFWRGKEQNNSLIVPSPMNAIYGKTKSGRRSMHTLENTGTRRFLVCELDQGDKNEQFQILFHLAGYAPLVMIVHSGSKSCHGWFRCAPASEEVLHDFFTYACRCGVDPHTWLKSQFVRLPQGRRETGELQQILYFNPEKL